ncbi:hypothetical protein FJT64_007980 [Amphibalanus amphitrite]|uniref:Uncharacterized protein n=1 Tax=Amphibalanus amphitrite TaxID=1232801 RepID=A0A6A4VRX9_AMPAM|nr:hypothetical protein FJT64_007980 [Amphibalanus amphitrite]
MEPVNSADVEAENEEDNAVYYRTMPRYPYLQEMKDKLLNSSPKAEMEDTTTETVELGETPVSIIKSAAGGVRARARPAAMDSASVPLATVDSIDSEADFVDGVDAALAVAGDTGGGHDTEQRPPAEPALCLSNRAVTPMLEGGGSVVARLNVDANGSGK